jgi:hypothetical protein
LSELWRHHRFHHCTSSSAAGRRSGEIEAALVGSHGHAFRFVKK